MNAMNTQNRKPFLRRKVYLAVAICIGASGFHGAWQVFADEVPAEAEISSLATDALEADIVTFTDIVHRAMADSPDIDIADARIDQATQLARQTGSYRFPKIELSGAAGPEYNDPAPSDESGVATTTGRNLKLIISRVLFDGGTSRAEFNRSKRLESAAQAEAQIAVENLFLDVALFYIDYWRYQLELVQADTFVDTMQTLVDDLNSMYQGGAASKLEVDFARARLASARGIASAATASLNNAFSELEYLVPGLTAFTAVSPESFSSLELLSLPAYIEHGASFNSGFMTNALTSDATRLRVSAQKGRFLPTLDLELSGSIIDEEGGPSVQRDKAAAKLLLTYTLYSGGERRGGVRRAQAQLRELEAERAQLERDVFRSIDQSYNNITASKLTLDAVLDEISANVELQRLNRQNLKLGTVNIIELIDVEERLFNANARKNEVIASMYQEYLGLTISAGFTPQLLEKHQLTLTGL